MGLSKDDTVTPASPPHTSALRRLQIRWRWRVRTLMGWKVEGAFPNLHEPRLILLGPGLSRTSGWTDFIEMRFRHQCIWWSLDMAPPQNAHVLVATEEHNLGEVLKWASGASLQIHLVHRDGSGLEPRHQHRAGPALKELCIEGPRGAVPEVGV